MKLLITTSRYPYPLEKGDKLRLFYQLVELSKVFEIHLFCLSLEKPNNKALEALKPYCKSMHVAQRSKSDVAINLGKAIFSQLPFQVAYFKSSEAKIAFNKFYDEIKPDAIYAHLIRTAWLSLDIETFKVIDLMDAFSHGMLERSKNTSVFKRKFFKIESERVAHYEQLCHRTFNHSTVISDQDQKRLALGDNNSVINNGVSSDYFKAIKTKDQYDLVFVGNLGYKPNIDAVKYIVNKILPAFKQGATPELLIAGARPSTEILNFESKNIQVRSWLEDIREAYSSGKIFIAPIFGGMGQQNKILEAMSIGVPCIVSKEVALGLNVHHNQEVLIANSTEEFVQAINNLRSDTALAKKLIKNAKTLIEAEYEWSKKTWPLIEILKKYQD